VPDLRHQSFDRGFDFGNVDVPPTRVPVLERTPDSKAQKNARWKGFMALAMVLVMIASAFTIVVSNLPNGQDVANPPEKETPAIIQYGGSREVTYSISNIGESYLKPDGVANNSLLGRHGSVEGLNDWWTVRTPIYGDLVIRDKYPCIVANSPYHEGFSAPSGVNTVGLLTYSFYRESVTARNLTTIATGPGKDPIFIPILKSGGLADDGGWVNFTWYFTYLTSQNCVDLKAGVEYGNTYYWAPPQTDLLTGLYANDGYWVEQQGMMDFDRNAAKKFLNLPGVGSLTTEFKTANAGGALNTSWTADWVADGSAVAGAKHDTFCAYDYSLNAYLKGLRFYLWPDPSSGTDKLVLRIWGISWGNEVLMMRYLDDAGVMSNVPTYTEDAYLNGTIGPNGGDLETRMVNSYHMTAWKDPSFYSAAWMLDAWHFDWRENDAKHLATYWKSRFTNYEAKTGHTPVTPEWAPGTVWYGQDVAYWQPPMNWNLTANENIIIKLPTRPAFGIAPYASTSDTLNAAKVTELNNHKVWGEMVLGNCYPASVKSYYDSATKTLTLNGPMNFDPVRNGLFPTLNLTGSPMFVFDVARVSDYAMAMVEPGPYSPGVTYHATVTALNYSGVVVTDWNGTVDMTASAGVTLGATSHWYRPADLGVWTVDVVFTAPGVQTITATDRNNSADVFDTLTTPAVIPEFPTLLIPVIGAAALVVVFAKRTRLSKKDT